MNEYITYKPMNIYISSSWKNREQVRELATKLRARNCDVYDFTDPMCRRTPEIPPEKYPELFDPLKEPYAEYLDRVPEWKAAVLENKRALDRCDLCVLLLPCGNDSHADWAYAVGRGKRSVVVGNPKAGERCTTHLWADAILRNTDTLLSWLDAQ